MTNFDGNDDILDSRDIIDYIEDIETDPAFYVCQVCNVPAEECEVDDHHDDDSHQFEGPSHGYYPETYETYQALKRLNEEGADNFSDWVYGTTLIHEAYFITYAQELAEDISPTFKGEYDWPYCHIDWDSAAQELLLDYGSIEFMGSTYYVRN